MESRGTIPPIVFATAAPSRSGPSRLKTRCEHDRLDGRRGTRRDQRGDRVGRVVEPVGEREGDREHDRDHETRVHQRTLRLARRRLASAKNHMRRTQWATQGNVAIPMFKAYGKPTIAFRINADGTSYVHST